MELLSSTPWIGLLGLGFLHGVNPAMGWLFAVALGLQRQDRRVVWGALAPLALGHAAGIAVTILVAVLVGLVIPMSVLKWLVAALLAGFGIRHLVRHRHPRGGKMQAGWKDLVVWSYLVASAHGAGLMVLPFILDDTAGGPISAAGGHVLHSGAGDVLGALPSGELIGVAATLIHTAGYLLATGLVAVVVYEKVGLRLLRSAWINLDLVWAVALIGAALLTPFI